MKKPKLPNNAKAIIPVVFFFTAADIIIFVLQFGKSLNEITQIGILSRYCGELSLVLFLFMLLEDYIKNRPTGKAEKKRGRHRSAQRRRGGRKNKQTEIACTELNTAQESPDVAASNLGASADPNETVAGDKKNAAFDSKTAVAVRETAALDRKTVLTDSGTSALDGKTVALDTETSALDSETADAATLVERDEIVERSKADSADAPAGAAETQPKDDGKKKRKNIDREKLVKVLYIIAVGQLLVRMCFTAFRYSADQLLSNTHDYTMAEAAVLGIFAAAAFFFKSRVLRSTERASVTFAGLYASAGVAFAVYAAVFAVTAVLKLKIYPYLSWFYRFCLVYIALMIAVGLVLSIIRREVPGEMNYGIYIPAVNVTRGETLADTLEKYTGLSLKSLWSIKLIGSALPGALLALAILLMLSTCIYKVEPYEEAAVYRFGALSEVSVTEGLHFKLPYPIDKAEIYEVHRVKSVTVGYESTGGDDNLWNGTHASEEYKLLTGDGNELVSVNLKLNYRISDLTKYIKASSEPERILTAFAYETVLSHTAFTDLDTLMSVDRTSLSSTVKDEINARLKETDIGVNVDEVILESIHPPVEIADVYQSVVSAEVKKTTLITNAEREANSTVTNAEKTAKTSINDAKARQTEKVAAAQYDAAVFDAADEAYRAHPESFKLSNYLDTFVTAVKGKKMYVITPSAESSMNDFIINRTDGNVTVVE